VFDKPIEMKQYTITIPDDEEFNFIELIKSLSYITNIEKNSILDIPEEHKQLVRERIEKYKNSPESYMTWEDIENKLKLD
jgi:tyrosyl-tRNA synthetase